MYIWLRELLIPASEIITLFLFSYPDPLFTTEILDIILFFSNVWNSWTPSPKLVKETVFTPALIASVELV